MRALLLSSSSYKDSGYLIHAREWVREFFGSLWDEEILFIPYAGVSRTNEEYEKKVRDALENQNFVSIHHFDDKKSAIKNAKSIVVGGGNTFMLMHYLYKFDLVGEIQNAVRAGTPYFGWSAGANIAGKTIMTTNDMPIIMPKSFDSLNLFPFQINPHFISGKISGHNGESREQRLEEFLIANQNSIVYALPEGTGLLVGEGFAEVFGHCEILKFEYQKDIEKIKIGEKINF